MAQKSPKGPKFGPNKCNCDISNLGMSQNYVESDTDCPETILQKSKSKSKSIISQEIQEYQALFRPFWAFLDHFGYVTILDFCEIIFGYTVSF